MTITKKELHERAIRAMDAAQSELGLPPDVNALLLASADVDGEIAIGHVIRAEGPDAVFVMLDVAMAYFLQAHPEYRERIANAVAAAHPDGRAVN